jgi:tetratricopeptide (TPR) repeat protein
VIKARAAAKRAVEKGKDQGSQQLVARAYGILCQLQGGAMSSAESAEACETAIRSYHAFGDRNNEARTMNDLAGLYYQQGDLDRSEALFREAIRWFRQFGNIEGATTASSNLGDIYMARGNLSEAARTLSDAIPGYREIGDKDGLALTFNDFGQLARLRGDLDAALSSYQQGRTTAQEIDDQRAVAYIANGIGDVQVDKGDLAGAHKSYEEALALRKQIGDIQSVAETELSLAILSIEDQHAADSEAVIRKCKDQFHQNQQADDEFSAGVALVKALLDQGKNQDAAKASVELKPLAASSGNKLIQLEFDLVAARTQAASGDLKSARAQLDKALHEARSRGMLGLEFETRLALAELKQESGEKAAASADLAALEKQSRGKGFGLIATKAASLREGK